jgi:hypothetical protein
MKLTRDTKSTRRKTCPSATLSTIIPTWTDAGSNPNLRGRRTATKCLNHGTALSTLCGDIVSTTYNWDDNTLWRERRRLVLWHSVTCKQPVGAGTCDTERSIKTKWERSVHGLCTDIQAFQKFHWKRRGKTRQMSKSAVLTLADKWTQDLPIQFVCIIYLAIFQFIGFERGLSTDPPLPSDTFKIFPAAPYVCRLHPACSSSTRHLYVVSVTMATPEYKFISLF